jgi:hypothetical protein
MPIISRVRRFSPAAGSRSLEISKQIGQAEPS